MEQPPKVYERPDVDGLIIRFGWLPSLAYEEDWADLAALQERLIQEDAQMEYERWQAGVRQSWEG
jgi:hypothetical protein